MQLHKLYALSRKTYILFTQLNTRCKWSLNSRLCVFDKYMYIARSLCFC